MAALGTVAVALCLCAAPASAPAASNQQSIFMDDNLLLYRGDDVSDRTLSQLAQLGVDTVRVSVPWRAIAPDHRATHRAVSLQDATDPADYPAAAFDSWDHVVRSARHDGIGVLFNVTGGAPLWATGRLDGRHPNLQYKPDPNAFQQFVTMLGRRYDGTYRDENQGGGVLPRVHMWSIWNEPNQGAHLQPQWERDPRTGRFTPYAPRLYRRLARAAIQGLGASGHGADDVLLGETSPLGSRSQGRKRAIAPGLFIRELFCLDARLNPLHGAASRARACDFVQRRALKVTGYAHHPYSIKSPPDQPDPNLDDITFADRDRLEFLLDVGGAFGRIPAHLPVWFTEYGYQTLPPDPLRGIGLEQQGEWLSEAEYLSWQDPRIVAQTQFLMRDDVPRAQYPASSPKHWGTYQSGIAFADGTRKPAYAAYRLPFYAPASVPPGAGLRLWGLVRPGDDGRSQSVTIWFQPDGATGFSQFGDPIEVTDPRGYFETTVKPPSSGLWRYVWHPPAEPQDSLLPSLGDPSPPPPEGYASQALAVRVG